MQRACLPPTLYPLPLLAGWLAGCYPLPWIAIDPIHYIPSFSSLLFPLLEAGSSSWRLAALPYHGISGGYGIACKAEGYSLPSLLAAFPSWRLWDRCQKAEGCQKAIAYLPSILFLPLPGGWQLFPIMGSITKNQYNTSLLSSFPIMGSLEAIGSLARQKAIPFLLLLGGWLPFLEAEGYGITARRQKAARRQQARLYLPYP